MSYFSRLSRRFEIVYHIRHLATQLCFKCINDEELFPRRNTFIHLFSFDLYINYQMTANIRSASGKSSASPLHMQNEVSSPSPLRQFSASLHPSVGADTCASDIQSNKTDYSSSNHISNLSESLHQIDFDSPAKIFQSKHAIHQFENVTPDVSEPGSPTAGEHRGYESDEFTSSGTQTPASHYTPPEIHTPRSKSPEIGCRTGDKKHRYQQQHHQHAKPSRSPPIPSASSSTDVSIVLESPSRAASQLGSISRTSTPSQFVFKKPEYNSHYHHTHFHHLEKKETIFHDLKQFFKKSQDKKKKKHLLDDSSSVRSSSSSVYSRQSDLSFANEFNKNLEGRYGKWGIV